LPIVTLLAAAFAACGSTSVRATLTSSPLARSKRPISIAASTMPPPELMSTCGFRAPTCSSALRNSAGVSFTIAPSREIHSGHFVGHSGPAPRTIRTRIGGPKSGAFGRASA
jgi:hypothetical protein